MCFSNGVKGLKQGDDEDLNPYYKPTLEFKETLKKEFADFEPSFIDSFYKHTEENTLDKIVSQAQSQSRQKSRSMSRGGRNNR